MSAAGPSAALESIVNLSDLADFATPISIGVVAGLGVADHLAHGARHVADLAQATGSDATALLRVLSALSTRGIFEDVGESRFALTPLSDLLRTDHPQSLRHVCLMLSADVEAWAAFEHSILTGEAAFGHVHRLGFWEYLESNPEAGGLFDRSMEAMTRLELLALVDSYEWGELGTVVDVGGGNGAFLAGLLARYPALRGVLVDAPHVAQRAAAVLEQAGVHTRCEIVPQNFFDSVPGNADTYVLKRIIYSWGDEAAIRILRTVRAAIGDHDGRVLVIEPVLRKGNIFDVSRRLDLQMLVLGQGRVRNRDALRQIFSAAGLTLRRVIPTPLIAILEGRPAAEPS
jgi:hypothetical protein